MAPNTKIRQLISFKRIIATAALLLLIILSQAQLLSAQSITQGYKTDDPVQRGMIVMLKENDGSKVVVASTDKGTKLFGVVVNANDSPVTLSNTDTSKVFVATQGHFDVLVTDENGPIKTGDYISISSINGIGMKADTRQPLAVAKSLQAFDGKSGVLSSTKVGNKTVNIGRIPADVAVGHNPLAVPEKNSVPKILQTTSEFIARKSVSAPRVYASIGVLFLTMIISGSMFFIGVRSSMIAIGRNPLSKKDILRGMLQVIFTSLIVFIIGLFAVYLLLKL